jgi:hypothetical protein
MVVERWCGTLGVFLMFALNVVLRQGVSDSTESYKSVGAQDVSATAFVSTRGKKFVLTWQWYIVCYALAIYILNLFLAFLQPRFDPSVAADLAADDVEEGAPGLPGGSSTPRSSGGIKGLMAGFKAEGDDEEFRPFIRRLPGMSDHSLAALQLMSQNSNSGTLRRKPILLPCSVLSPAQPTSPSTGQSCLSTSSPCSESQ